jgi:hypothetical protein
MKSTLNTIALDENLPSALATANRDSKKHPSYHCQRITVSDSWVVALPGLTESNTGYSTSSPRSPNNIVIIRASVCTLEAIRTTTTFPLTTPDLHHHHKHSQASRIFSPRVFLSDVKVLLAALKTRSHCVAMAGQDKWSRAYRWSVSFCRLSFIRIDGRGMDRRDIARFVLGTLLQCEEDTVRRDGRNTLGEWKSPQTLTTA